MKSAVFGALVAVMALTVVVTAYALYQHSQRPPEPAPVLVPPEVSESADVAAKEINLEYWTPERISKTWFGLPPVPGEYW